MQGRRVVSGGWELSSAGKMECSGDDGGEGCPVICLMTLGCTLNMTEMVNFM